MNRSLPFFTSYPPFTSDELVVDLFAGGGGASVGIEAAIGRKVDLAINHDETALTVHYSNHPKTRHLPSDIWEVNPKVATEGRRVALLWASPDCTHFSVAKGGKPRKQNIRSLAWVVVRWARDVRPRVIFLENVAEFRGWGPLGKDGQPDKKKMGTTFKRWLGSLEKLGYQVDYRVLDASLYGAPTRRRRLFLVARCDGQPIQWPEPTHGPGRLPLRTAAECIDWSLPCPSIFERSKPLAEKTLWRIAQGIKRFVLENPRPFVIRYNGREPFRGQEVEEPLTTLDTSNRFGLVSPSLVEMNHSNAPRRVDEPLGVVTTQHNRFNVVAPHLVKVNHGGEDARGEAIDEPLSTVTATQRGHAVVAPTLIQTSYGERQGQRPRYLDLHQPLGTVVAQGQKHAMVAAHLQRQFGKGVGEEPDSPMPTIMPGGGGKTALCAALLKHYGGVVGQELEQPAGTITAVDHHALAAATLVKLRGDCHSAAVDEPLPALTAGGFHVGEVRAFLTAYYGDDATSGQNLQEPMRTITAKHRLGLVTIQGVEFQIVDIGMRMLEPHELLAAQFGKYAATYDLSAAKTKAAKVRLIGNSVCPEIAEAIIRANVGEALPEEAVA